MRRVGYVGLSEILKKKKRIDLIEKSDGLYLDDSKDKESVLVVSTNIGLDHALGIARSGYETYYSVVHSRAFPSVVDEIDGYGFSEITKIWDWGDALEAGCETVVFTDSGFGAIADWMRGKGISVFGGDDRTEKLELDRVYFKKVMESLGIKTPKYDIANGVDELRRIIAEKGMRYVKVSRFRGAVETFLAKNPDMAEMKIRMSDFGIFGNIATFIAEEPVGDEYIEIGFDAFFNGKEFLGTVFDTIEKKGYGNFTVVRKIEESPWYDVLMKFEPYLKENGYRGMFCAEGFWNGSEIYVTDITPRYPYVCSYAYPRLIENYGEVVCSVANGEDCEVKTKNKYSAQSSLYTDVMKWKEVEGFVWENVAMRRAVKVGSSIWWIPVEDNVVAVAISCGDDVRSVLDSVVNISETISFSERNCMVHGFVSILSKELDRLRELKYI